MGSLSVSFPVKMRLTQTNMSTSLSQPTSRRNNLIINTSHAIIAIEGESGTLNEITTAWVSEKPIAVLMKTGGWSEKLANSKLDDQYDNYIYGAESPQDALNYVLEKLRG